MNIKELRIGSIIQDKEGNYLRVDGLADDRIRTTTDGMRWYMPTIFSGIPITEEILLKCGFEKTEYGYESDLLSLSYGKYLLGCPDDDNNLYISINSAECGIGGEIKSLHQLQNIYFDLTGEELDITL